MAGFRTNFALRRTGSHPPYLPYALSYLPHSLYTSYLSYLPNYFDSAHINCDLFVLKKEDLDEVLETYPQIRKRITAHAQNEIIKAKQIEIVAKTLDQVRRSTRGRKSVLAEGLRGDASASPEARFHRRSKVASPKHTHVIETVSFYWLRFCCRV